ncbi:ammonia-dependent NAD(+) synthetase [Micromonospora sp. U56]|uniref:ammonia-dependent NAD(+) synthetase n=1 Tax=Micromonospora sp. U56 TaxID=2824900 RepID=UPI001B37F7F6|nr:ammonia-dependent NAD(+) synthetase [Micromonospora sp. U56]MBQ0892543.1 ammonia-dependent NAD(+) synthetase [Micromonospora sp. U56]
MNHTSATENLAAYETARQRISHELRVNASVGPHADIERRVAFLTDTLYASGRTALVLGISGGIDSTVTAKMCQLAVERVRQTGHPAVFIAMRLPCGAQHDEGDAAAALDFIQADQVLTGNIQPASDACLGELIAAGLVFRDRQHQDFVLGNIKARQRMVLQYAVAGALDGLVVGTDHAAEAVTGFFTKYGDGAADIVPLTGLTKRRIRTIAQLLGAPDALVGKAPTADLETLAPGKPDEDVFGFTYDNIDDFLEGRPVPSAIAQAVLDRYHATAHKRHLPVAPG